MRTQRLITESSFQKKNPFGHSHLLLKDDMPAEVSTQSSRKNGSVRRTFPPREAGFAFWDCKPTWSKEGGSDLEIPDPDDSSSKSR